MGMEALSSTVEGFMVPGDKMPMGQYEIEFVDIRQEYDNPEYLTTEANLVLWKDGEILKEMHPGQDLYENRGQYISTPDKHSTLRGDVYTLLLDYSLMMGYVTIQVADNPLVNFMWLGALLMVLGAALAASRAPVLGLNDAGETIVLDDTEELYEEVLVLSQQSEEQP
jgi:cytochrome c-type biogenesis protein CcmF